MYAGAVENTSIKVAESMVTNSVGMAVLSFIKAPILSYLMGSLTNDIVPQLTYLQTQLSHSLEKTA